MAHYRKLDIDGRTFEYVVGHNVVKIKLPGGGSLTPSRSPEGMIRPSDVAAWIRENVKG